MAELGKILAQFQNTVPATSEEIYLAPAGRLSKVESIFVCNIGANARTFDISVDKTGDNPGSPQSKDYLYYHRAIAGGETVAISTVIRMEAGDRMEGASDEAGVIFNVYGTEY